MKTSLKKLTALLLTLLLALSLLPAAARTTMTTPT